VAWLLCTQDIPLRTPDEMVHGVAEQDEGYESRRGLDQEGVDDAGGADGLVLGDEADAGMDDAGCDMDRQGKGAEDWEESSSSASVDVSSGYDDSSSSDGADDSDKGNYESAAGWKEPARVRKSDRLLDLIQGGAVWSMLDEDDADDAADGGALAKSARHEPAAAMPERMLAERLAAESERSLVAERLPAHAASCGAGGTRGRGRGACSADRADGRGRGARSSSPAQDEADPQFPQSVASAACALWTAAAAGDGAGLCRTLRRGGAASLDIGDPADAGATALMKAARAGALESVMQLLRAGADTEAHNSGGETAMHAAAGTGHVEIIDALVAAGASVAATSASGDTPLHLAAALGNVRACAALIALGADLAAAARDGATPLHRCAAGGHAAAARALLALGAVAEARDGAGRTAYAVALATGPDGRDCAEALCAAEPTRRRTAS